MANLNSIVSPEAVAKVLKNKAVKQHLAQKQEAATEERRTNVKRLKWSAGLGAAGLGLKTLGDQSMTPEDRSAFDNLAGLSNSVERIPYQIPNYLAKPLPENASWTDKLMHLAKVKVHRLGDDLVPSMQPTGDAKDAKSLFYDYIDRATTASKAKFYGRNPEEFLHGESMKPLMAAIGHPVDPPTWKPDMNESKELWQENENHYKSFREGPVPAYWHQLKKIILQEDNRDAGRALAPDDDRRLAQPGSNTIIESTRGQFTGDQHTNMHQTLDRLQKNWDGFLKNQNITDPNTLNHAQQMDALRRFDGYVIGVDPALSKIKDHFETEGAKLQSGPISLYPRGIHAAETLTQDVPHALGYAAMGLGALGAGWYGFNKIKKWRQDSKQLNKMSAFEQAFEKRAEEILSVISKNQ